MEVQSQNLDRISALPQDTIEQILTLMPIRDAIRTSILSKKWRYCWTRMPKLVFDDNMVDVSSDKKMNKNKLVNAVFHVLILHKGLISELSICIRDTEIEKEFDPIILHLSQSKSIKKFSLDFNNSYKLPCSFFSLKGLKHLELSFCTFKLPLIFNGFSMLKSLIFVHVDIRVNMLMLQRFLTSCPLLEEFTWIWYKPLKFTECEFVEFFKSLPSIQILEISLLYIEDLGAGDMPHKLPISPPHLRTLGLSVCFRDLSTVVYVMSSSPNLEKIKIKMCGNHDRWECDKRTSNNLLVPQDYSGLKLDHFKELEITRFRDRGFWMEFVKFIMGKSPLLKKARITLHSHVSVDKENKMLQDFVHMPLPPTAMFIVESPRKIFHANAN